MTKNRESRPSQQPRPICRRYPASTRPSRVIMSTNAMARSACSQNRAGELGEEALNEVEPGAVLGREVAGIDLLTGKVHALVRDRHRSRDFIEFLKLLDATYPTSR